MVGGVCDSDFVICPFYSPKVLSNPHNQIASLQSDAKVDLNIKY